VFEQGYKITIYGDFTQLYLYGSEDAHKLLKVNNWGKIQWSSMDSMFFGATNLLVWTPLK